MEAVKTKDPNKEASPLLKKNYSNSNQIDFDGIHKHIAYTFKDPKLLQQALHPLPPKTLQHEDNKFD